MPRRKQIIITPENLGENIKTIRELEGVTQDKLAEQTDISFMSIIRTEKGRNSPSFENLYKIATALGYKVALV